MKIKNILVITAMVLSLATVASATSAGITDIEVLGNGDGYWTNYVGTSSDYFDSTSNSVNVNYQYWGSSWDLATKTGYLQFGLSSAPDISDIASVELFGYFNSAYLTPPTPDSGSIYHVSNSSGANGNASQRLNGDEFLDIIDPEMPMGWNSMDVTDIIISDLTNGYSWSAFSFNPNTTGTYNDRYAGFSIASAESGNASFLRFTTGNSGSSNAVPEPATMLLFGTGLAGIFIRKKQKV